MDATLNGFDWDALERRVVPLPLRDIDVVRWEDDREPLLRATLAARPAPGDPGVGAALPDRLATSMAWARLDVPVAVLATGHMHAEDLLGGTASRYPRPDALWAVWSGDGDPLRASDGGPVYRLDGVVARPLGGGITTHAVVVAEAPEDSMLFAVDLRHPRVHVMTDVAPGSGSPVEYRGAFRFERVPATPLAGSMPSCDGVDRYRRLSSIAVVVGAVSGLVDDVSALSVGSAEEAAVARQLLDRLAGRLLQAARAVDGPGTGRPLPWFDTEIGELAVGVRTVATALLEYAASMDGRPGSPSAERAAQLRLALRLAVRAF